MTKSEEPIDAASDKKLLTRQLMAVLLGAICYFVLQPALPRPPYSAVQSNPTPSHPAILKWAFQFALLLQNPYVVLASFIWLVFGAFYWRKQKRSWAVAFAGGMGLSGSVMYWIFRLF
jgi:hypothetical protein